MTGADIFAHAVVASAQTYGDNPLLALSVVSGRSRRCVLPAAVGVAMATGMSLERAGTILGVQTKNLSRSRVEGGLDFEAAVDVARWAALKVMASMGVQTWGAPSRALHKTFAAIGRPRPVVADPAENPAPVQAKIGKVERPPARTLNGRVLDYLRDRPGSAPTIATVLGLKELSVSQGLQQMEGEGLVIPGVKPAEGLRFRMWYPTALGAA